jgi:thiol-disulfide isomerase/thioredoxin
VKLIEPGSKVPSIEGTSLAAGEPRLLFFYKVDCPVCQMAAPKAELLAAAYPEAVVGVGEDPSEALSLFSQRYDMSFTSLPDEAPYSTSDAYGISVVPTLVLVDGGGTVVDVVQSWNRDAWNAISRELSDLTGNPYAEVSSASDGFPHFRPG